MDIRKYGRVIMVDLRGVSKWVLLLEVFLFYLYCSIALVRLKTVTIIDCLNKKCLELRFV